ncbi:hypothetical protein [Aneurinibacillus danicus]|uniref:SIR2-like domain-containing protein n=1 Tax=Aneurinibacillus danicus TaxID=267746 RepID=A0A511VCI3_9BACL|nr:hypothetical protein [Aneurinibacillus danicus]GEN36600.1 hypothetical protein ADA01nite_40600 [Aneurinibacillus danicus]
MSKPKISFFFGAGAEISYGLPSGGKFALEIFRSSSETDKEDFRKQVQSISPTSVYAAKWLPENYQTKRLHVFGKGEFEGLIASSLEYRRGNILGFLDDFDENVNKILSNWDISEEIIREKFYEETGIEFGAVLYGQVIKLNEKLAEKVKLFDSEFFSAFLKVLEFNQQNRNLKRVVRAFLELLVGACGQNLVSRLNEELFEQAPDELSVFDDLSGIFNLNYQGVGQTGMEIVIEEQPVPIDESFKLADVFAELGKRILEEIYSQALDYQALIDSHFRYLYNPKAQWAKFTRISIFLHTVRRYIKENVDIDKEKLKYGPGYYHDLLALSDKFEIHAIGTTNYNNFVELILKEVNLDEVPVYHLNGSVHEYYDPYLNSIYYEGEEQKEKHILVPFIFTQSGIKPLTSVSMSRRYVDLYDRFAQSDIICIIGYGFGGDDGHINGMLRSLAEEENKKIFIAHYGVGNVTTLKREYQSKLRLSSTNNLEIIPVDDQRGLDNKLWYENLCEAVD